MSKQGKISSIMGAVVDIEFHDGKLPEIYNAVAIDRGNNEKLMPFLHLPIQSGSNKILRQMNRRHNVKKYFEIVDKLKNSRPDIALSSDFIVGFPDETNKDFDEDKVLVLLPNESMLFPVLNSIPDSVIPVI